MDFVYQLKLKKKHFEESMAGPYEGLSASSRNLAISAFLAVGFLVFLGMGTFAWRWGEGAMVGFIFATVIVVIAMFVWFALLFGVEARRKKVYFVERVARDLLDDIAPESRIKVTLDGTHYDESVKIIKTSESLMGNTKHYYRDKWMRMRLTLAEGTKVEIAGRRLVKTKKGGVLKDKRRVDLYFQPNSDRYPTLDAAAREQLRGHFKRAVRQCFHDPPEELHVRLRADSDHIYLKVEQWDAEILAPEIVALVHAYVDFMDRHRFAGAQAAW